MHSMILIPLLNSDFVIPSTTKMMRSKEEEKAIGLTHPTMIQSLDDRNLILNDKQLKRYRVDFVFFG